jgi:hypothetical protein
MHVLGYASWGSAYAFLEERAVAAPLPRAVRVAPREDFSFHLPADVVVSPLEDWPGPARRFAARRGITADQVARWGLGYAADGRLAGRIVFPIRNRWGVPTSYHSRLFAGEGPRYLTPDRREGADLDAVFGEQHWESDLGLRKKQTVVVWEGAIKALAFERACPGRPFGVLGGVDLQPGAVLKLVSFGRILVATDDDAAGDAAARKFDSLSRHVTVGRVKLPRDPDEMPSEEVARIFEGLS